MRTKTYKEESAMLKTQFCDNWRFARTGEPLRPVSIPHDAMILEERKKGNPSGAGCAYFAGGCYEYEKEFTLPEGQQAVLLFEGVYPMGKITLDGADAAFLAYGYGDYFVDCSHLADGKTHRIHVTVDNTGVPNSRWYSGAGIYRPVWLFTGPEAHIAPEGIRVSTVSIDPAVIRVQTKHTGETVTIEILDGDRQIATAQGDDVTIEIPSAKLWDAEHPNLYTCRARVGQDSAQCRFGIRTLQWSYEGLFINGKSVKLQGGCIHHDNGIIGARSFAYSEYRRMKKMKEFGFNAVRSAHHPICRSLLDACDELGLYVMDESWDMWYDRKTTYDYSHRFMENWEADMEAMVAKDFSHPSVIMYSIGNEVTEPVEEKGIELTRKLVDKCHQLDPSRPATAGINPTLLMMRLQGINIFNQVEQPGPEDPVSSTDFNKKISENGKHMIAAAATEAVDKASAPCLDLLDIAGYNYASSRYEPDAVQHPGRILVGSETFPQDLPANWALVKKLPYLYGDFMWTAWDYIGEVGIGAWSYCDDGKGFTKHYPWLLGDVGAFDILGDDNAEAGMASVIWGARKTPYIGVRPVNQNPDHLYKAMWRGTNAMPSWSWQGCEGRTAQVEVYSDASEIELQLNGICVGRASVNEEFRADFEVPYAPGTLTAIAYNASGERVGESSLVSASGKAAIRATAENAAVIGQPLYVNIDIVGENGEVQRNCDRKLQLHIEGAELLGFGSASPRTEERFESGSYTTYYGRSQAVLLPQGKTVTLRITAEGLDDVQTDICVQN